MSKVHAILSDLHRLLSAYERDDLVRASRYPGLSRPLKDALTALASEAPAAPASPPIQRRKSGESRETSTLNSDIWKKQLALADSILKSSYGTSVGSLRSFISNRGLKLDIRPKESKERIARRLSHLLTTLPESKRNQIFADLLGEVSSQTQGWINVIKGNKL
jgi:hypothetical protein